jgi:phospholipid/cholesterol/gamma-HCH transport system permease protein
MNPSLAHTLENTLRDLGRATLRWLRQWLYIARLAAQIMAWALSPRSYPRAQRPELARHIYQSAGPSMLWYVLMFGLFGLVLVRIVVVSAQSYGLSRYALEMVVRVLVLELLPLAAALFVALRCAIPYGSEVSALRAQGEFDALAARGIDPMRQEVLPRVLAGVFAVWLLTALSAVVTLVLSYLVVYGFNPFGWATYTRTVGQVFGPAVTLVFVVKTLLFSLAVAVVPMAAATQASPSQGVGAEIQGLVRMFMLLLAFEALSLLGNYY